MENTVRLALSCQVVQIIFLLALMMASAHCNAQRRRNITDLDCFNDYLTEMFCSWRVPDPGINCSHDFQLEYKNRNLSSHCVPESIALADTMLYTGCICHIKADFFVASDEYYIQIKSHGISIASTTFLAALKVKPRAPANVTIEHNGEIAKVHWDSSYTWKDYLFQKLKYDIQITSKQDPTQVKGITLIYLEPQYIIRKRLFRKGHDFLVKIRSMPNNINYSYAGIWSEWSPEIQWHNDYDLSAYDIIENMMPVIGPAFVICILLCFASGLICKRKWWNNIPDPSNSHLAMTMLHTTQVPGSESDVNCSILPLGNHKKKRKTICSKWLKKLISRNQDNKQPKTHKSTPYYTCIDRAAVKNVFIPEMIAVERTLSLTSLVVDTNLENEPPSKENHEEVQPLECDFINRMFLEILNTDSKQDKVMDLSDNVGTKNMNGSILLEDISYEDGKHIGLLSNYTRVNSPAETQSEDFNQDQEFCFWKDSSPFALTLNSNGSCPEMDYKSSAVWQYKTVFDDSYKPMVSDFATVPLSEDS